MRRADHSSRGVIPTVVRIVCDLETARIRMSCPALGSIAAGEKINNVKCDGEYCKIPQTSSRKPLCRVAGVFVVLSVSFILGN